MTLRKVSLLLGGLASACAISQCQWNSADGCKTCRHNLYLHNGNCLETCPDGYVERRPSWAFSWKRREVGRTCEKSGEFAVKAWGDSSFGGSDPGLTSRVAMIFSNYYAFAALKTDGSVKAWGNPSYGGTDPDPSLTKGVVTIFSTEDAFAALKTDGSVKTWGRSWGTDPDLTDVATIFSVPCA